ncbi:MAG: hypothetical protein HZA16_04595 [Nitrospirae bacterium]|nr:hypothetical protein [Nitrospirota bacterium]
MNKRILSLIYFLITVVILVAAIKIINYLPMVIQAGTIREYHSIEEVRSKLNIKDIYIPTYFPQGLVWPPSLVLAQDKPFTAVITEFKKAGKEAPALILSQSASATFRTDEKIRLRGIKEKISYPLKGRNMMLEAGVCDNEEPCSRITWAEGRYTITVTAKSEPPDLLKIAESMVHRLPTRGRHEKN